MNLITYNENNTFCKKKIIILFSFNEKITPDILNTKFWINNSNMIDKQRLVCIIKHILSVAFLITIFLLIQSTAFFECTVTKQRMGSFLNVKEMAVNIPTPFLCWEWTTIYYFLLNSEQLFPLQILHTIKYNSWNIVVTRKSNKRIDSIHRNKSWKKKWFIKMT